MDLIELLCLRIGRPDGGEAGGLGGHDIDADPEILTEGGDAGAYEFHDLILYEAVSEYCADDGQGHVLRTYAADRCPCQVDSHYLRALDVIGLVQQLLYQLRTALAHSHGAQCAVAGMGVGAQDHGAALCQHLSGELMDDCLVRRYIDAAVFLGSSQTVHVVIFINSAAYGTQGVVTVGQHIGHGETGQSGSPGRLDDAHEGDVMRGQLVKADAQCLAALRRIVLFQDLPCHGVVSGFLSGSMHTCGGQCLRRVLIIRQESAVFQVIHALLLEFYHTRILSRYIQMGTPAPQLGAAAAGVPIQRICSVFVFLTAVLSFYFLAGFFAAVLGAWGFFSSRVTLSSFQISSTYSWMVRSELNLPALAVLSSAILAQRVWSL